MSENVKRILIIVGALLLVGLVVALVIWKPWAKIEDADNMTSEEIRNIFTPPQNNIVVIPSVPVGEVLIRGGASNSSNIINTTTTPAIVYTTYSSTALGFKMEISNQWQATENGSDTVVFQNAKGEQIIVQEYAAPSEGLSLVKEQLQGSPSVSSVVDTSFKNQPALSFRANGNNGMAVIYNSRLYYIFAQSFTTEPLTTFSFQ